MNFKSDSPGLGRMPTWIDTHRCERFYSLFWSLFSRSNWYVLSLLNIWIICVYENGVGWCLRFGHKFRNEFLEFRGSNMVIMICAFHIHMCTISLVSSLNNFILFFPNTSWNQCQLIFETAYLLIQFIFLALKMKLNWEFKSWFVQFISPENHKQEQHHTSNVLWWIAKLVCLFRAVEFFFLIFKMTSSALRMLMKKQKFKENILKQSLGYFCELINNADAALKLSNVLRE